MASSRPLTSQSQGMGLGRKTEDDLSDISTPRSQDSDRVKSRRSLQQTSGDIFGRASSPYHVGAAGRLSSASGNSGRITLHDAMGSSSQVFVQEMLHNDNHESFETDDALLCEKQHSSLMDDGVHNLHMLPSDLEHIQVNDEMRGLFDYIGAYKAQQVEIGTILNPFIPDYILTVGAIDEFIKVPRPDKQPDYLGLKVLDESGSKQSDPAVLMLQLRAASSQPSLIKVETPSVEHANKNPRKLEAWINSIKELHQTKPPPMVIYSKQMPDMEKLMQEWPPSMEKVLAETNLPTATLDVEVHAFVDICCAILDIPIYNSRVESLHLMYSLYLELRDLVSQFPSGASDFAGSSWQ
ncbi:hypothetical protein R1sor_014917 [Riccia sorocarpa]|uniref:Intraflagellar transport protein 46 homolog n=1 Tax=Riccia sorocarpa TaxID=122646 RepID=A0ABD3HAR5_9MARC